MNEGQANGMQRYDVQLSTGNLHVVQASSIGEAVDVALWEHGYEGFILAVYPTGGYISTWRLIYADHPQMPSNPPERYIALEDALANNDDGTEILIAIPRAVMFTKEIPA